MAKKAIMSTQEYLINASLPEATDTYTVIPHGDIIKKTKEILEKKGLVIERELYRCNEFARVAQGVYHLKFGDDPDMGMMFCWSNSYDKSMKFKCSIGGFVHASLASIIGSNMGTYGRKHTGTADDESFETIVSQIEHAEEYFNKLLIDKESMKNIVVTEEQRAGLMGRLYIMHELLTGEQLALVRAEFNKPSFSYSGVDNSVWAMYNAIIYSLQKAHPRTWMDQQSMIHWFLCELFNIKPGVLIPAEQNSVTNEEPQTDPRQVDLVDSIEEVEKENALKEVDKPGLDGETFQLTIKKEEFGGPLLECLDPRTDEGNIQFANENGDSHTVMEVKTVDQIKEEHPEVYEMVEKQVEKVLNEEHKNNDAHTMPRESAESPEVMQEETAVELVEDDSWPCVKCGEPQGPTSLWNEGQLCTKCFNE